MEFIGIDAFFAAGQGADTGFIGQNVYLYCASAGLATVVRGLVDKPVLEKAIELGMNYLDTNMASEVALYGQAMAKAKIAKRDKFHIGFACWPVKITEEYEEREHGQNQD